MSFEIVFGNDAGLTDAGEMCGRARLECFSRRIARAYSAARIGAGSSTFARYIGGSCHRLLACDGRGALELVKFHSPPARSGERHAPANALGIRHLAFQVDDTDAAVTTVRVRGGELVGEVENYRDVYRLCYVGGPEGIIVELAERIA